MKKTILLLCFLLLSCTDNTGSLWISSDRTHNRDTQMYLDLYFNPLEPELSIDPKKIEYVHKKWWESALYNASQLWIKPDFTEEYYTLNDPVISYGDFGDPNKKYVIQWGDLYMPYEYWLVERKKRIEKLKNIQIISIWKNKYVIHDNLGYKLEDYEQKSWLKFHLDRYRFIEIEE